MESVEIIIRMALLCKDIIDITFRPISVNYEPISLYVSRR